MQIDIINLLMQSLGETIYMVIVSSCISFTIGIPLGILLCLTSKNHILNQPNSYKLLSTIVNITRSIPFIILMVAIIPFTRLIAGTSIGTSAAIVPLSIAAIPFVARLSENAFLQVPHGLIEATQAMGASNLQIIMKVLLPESMRALSSSLTTTVISLVGLSAMAGAIGGGGLGDLAIRYGYQRFDTNVMLTTVITLVVLVHLIQSLGNYIMNKFH